MNKILQSQVTSLEVSKKLKKAGFNVDTCFWWVEQSDITEDGARFECSILIYEEILQFKYTDEEIEKIIPTYTFQQLWEVLDSCKFESLIFEYNSINIEYRDTDGYEFYNNFKDFDQLSKNNHLPDLAGEAVLWCIKEEYLNIKDLKNEG